MKIHVVNNQVEGATVALDILKEKLNGGAKVLGLATGSSPLEFYRLIRESDLDFSDVTSVNLDEYVGLGEESDQSYIHFMKENLFNDKPFKKSYLPNGLATDVVAETERYNKILAEHPVDFQILGIGRNAISVSTNQVLHLMVRPIWLNWRHQPSKPTPASLTIQKMYQNKLSPWASPTLWQPKPLFSWLMVLKKLTRLRRQWKGSDRRCPSKCPPKPRQCHPYPRPSGSE